MTDKFTSGIKDAELNARQNIARYAEYFRGMTNYSRRGVSSARESSWMITSAIGCGNFGFPLRVLDIAMDQSIVNIPARILGRFFFFFLFF